MSMNNDAHFLLELSALDKNLVISVCKSEFASASASTFKICVLNVLGGNENDCF